MSNVFTSAVKQHWADMFQENLEKDLLAMELVKMENVPNGTTKNLPYINFQKPVQYVKYTSVTSVDAVTGNDQLVINQTPMVPFEIDRIDIDDNYLDVTPELISGAGYMLKSAIDGDVMGQALVANSVYNSNGLNGAGTAPVALTLSAGTGYIATVFGKSKSRLTAAGVNPQKLCMVVDSDTVDELANLGLEKGYQIADESYARGFRGMFKGMKVYESNNLTATRSLAMATNPTAGDTITVLGVTFTYVSSIGTTPGNILIAGSAAATVDNTVAAINGASGAGTNYIAIADPSVLAGVTATDNTTSILLTSKSGRMYADSTLTASADKFGAESVNCWITEKGATRLALRNSVEIKQDSDPDSLVEKFKVWSRYGIVTPTRGKARMVRILIQGSPTE
jgi:hypothetical protein